MIEKIDSLPQNNIDSIEHVKVLANDSFKKVQDIDSSLLKEVSDSLLKTANDSIFQLNQTIEQLSNQFRSSASDDIWGMDYKLARILIPVLVTLIVFLLGHLVTWIKSKYERKNEINSIKITIENWILLTRSPVIQQMLACRRFINRLRVSTDLQPELFEFSPLLIHKLNQIELREYIDTIMVNLKGDNKQKSKIIFNIISQLEYIERVESHIQENYNKFHSRTLELMEKWNNNFIEFQKELNDSSNSILAEKGKNEFTTTKNIVCSAFIEKYKGVQPYTIIYKELILPISEKANSLENKESVIKLLYIIDALTITIREWEVHKDGHIKMTYNFSKRIASVYKTLEKEANTLSSSKLRSIYHIK